MTGLNLNDQINLQLLFGNNIQQVNIIDKCKLMQKKHHKKVSNSHPCTHLNTLICLVINKLIN